MLIDDFFVDFLWIFLDFGANLSMNPPILHMIFRYFLFYVVFKIFDLH